VLMVVRRQTTQEQGQGVERYCQDQGEQGQEEIDFLISG